MILKGNQRGGGQQLAAHLMNSFDNEVIVIADVRGAVAHDLSGAFAEWAAQARATRCEKYIYSLSLSPDQSQGRLTREQYLDLIARTERSLKLVGQPRAVVFHEKRDKDGTLRQHAHVVWSRIDAERSKAVQMAHDRLKLRTVARQFARDHGLELPDGMKNDGRSDRFNRRARQENLAERQQQERTGVRKEERMAHLEHAWHNTTTGPAFVQAMEDKGYYLARGDSGRYVVVDRYGQVHSLYRQIEGVKAAEIKERLSGYPLDKQPDVESAKAYARQKLLERKQAQEKDIQAGGQKDSATGVEKRKTVLQERQAARRADLDKQRLNLFARQFGERGALRDMQAAESDAVAAARLAKQPKGLVALLTRVTGVGRFVAWAQNKADSRREAAHKEQTTALLRRHGRELKELDRHYRALDRLEKRENRSAETALQREGYRRLRVRSFELKPEFGRAAAIERKLAASETGARGYLNLFNRVASGIGMTRGDLQAAFERAANGKTRPAAGTGGNGHRPDPERLEELRRLRDDLDRRQSRPDTGRDRER